MRPDPVLARRRFLALSASTVGAAALGLSPFGRLLAQAGLPAGRIAGFGPLAPVADATTGLPLLKLPAGFSYRSFGWSTTPMSDGRPTPSHHDGMGIVHADGSRLTLVRNHECDGEAGTFGDASMTYDPDVDGGTTTMVFDADKGELLESRASLSGTLRNCSGGITPWRSWLSCEEQVLDRGRAVFDERVVDLKHAHGFVFDVPFDRASNAEPLVAMGQRVHEAAAVHEASGDVFLTEDADPFAGFYRFVPTVKGELARGGTLWMLKAEGAADLRRGHRTGDRFKAMWVAIEHPERGIGPSGKTDGNVREGLANGGSAFIRLEGCYAQGDTIYFTSTSGGDANSGQVWAYDAKASELQLVFESPAQETLYYPDNLAMSPRGGLILCQDSYRKEAQSLFGLTPEGGLFQFAENNGIYENFHGLTGDYSNSEFAGACFSPDGRWLFVNVYTPGFTVAITGPWKEGLL
ncbi:alkaline phosphatase PhoX [Silanimonas sp.]|uniref:alkaline phosphatase PhoX n=1 Tax=Silanimonas sp. TaxID=1929290 RepID=UPI0022C001A7|nr:alkaline phosphatase PhoX [Silanimonas sp.]MCZ8063904.1 DUF839 domain-containing protein [Silanimonas sp.]